MPPRLDRRGAAAGPSHPSRARLFRAWWFALAGLLACSAVQAGDDALPSRSEWRASSSSSQVAALAPAHAIDGDAKTRWGGTFSAGHWLQVDLGRESSVGGALISWDSGFAVSWVKVRAEMTWRSTAGTSSTSCPAAA